MRHGLPGLKASLAAAVALFTSSLSASATSQIVLPVAGLTVGKVLPLIESCHSLLMNSLVYLISGGGEIERDVADVAILLETVQNDKTPRAFIIITAVQLHHHHNNAPRVVVVHVAGISLIVNHAH